MTKEEMKALDDEIFALIEELKVEDQSEENLDWLDKMETFVNGLNRLT